MVRKKGESNQRCYLVHRFVYECQNYMITDNMVIDHINNKNADNWLSNLQLITTQENNKSAKNLDYSLDNHPRNNIKHFRAINVENNQFLYFNSMISIQQHLEIK